VKAIIVIGDGMADRPVRELGGKTPLEAAKKPSLNWVAETGVCGIMDPIAPGVPPGSDTAHLALLGYDVFKVYAGRGAFEALGCGVEVQPGDVAFRCNFATVDDNYAVVDRRAGRIETQDAFQLARDLGKVSLKDVRITFKNTVQHRAILLLRGLGLSARVSDSDPQKVGKRVSEVLPLDDTAEAEKTAKIVNEILQHFHEILKNHPVNDERRKKGLPPANIVLCRGAGTMPELTTLPRQYGIQAAAINAVPLVGGVCKAAGMSLVSVPGATGTYDTNVKAKANAAVQAVKSYDLVLVHVKATDVASHDGKVQQKIKMVEKIDDMVGQIVKNVDMVQTIVAVTADHTTSLLTGEHEGDPVPLAITGPGVRTDDIKEFSERACARGGLGRIRGIDLMPTLMNLLGKAKKFGA